MEQQKEFEKQLQRLSSLYKVSQAMASTIRLENLIELIMDLCIEELKADTGSLMLLDNKEILTIRSARGLTDDVVKETSIKLGEGIAGTVAQSKEPLLLIGKIEDHRFDGVIDREKIKSALCVPLTVKDRVRGVLSVNRINSHLDFTYEDLGLLCLFASQAASSIENAELFTQAQSRIHELSKINQVSQALNITRDEGDIFSIVAEALNDLVGFDACFFLLYQGEEDMLIESKITQPISQELLTKTKNSLVDLLSDLLDIPLAAGKAGFRVQEIGRFTVPISTAKRFACSTSLPLVIRGSVIGLINLSSLTPDAFSDDKIKTISTLAYTSATALDNTQLYKKMHQKVVELSTLFEVGKTISSTLDLERCLTLILEVSVRIMDASICSLRLLGEKHDIVLSASYGLSKICFKGKSALERRKSIAQQAMRERKPIIISDVRHDQEYIHPDYVIKERVSSLVCMPLVARGNDIGVLTVYSTQTRKFSKDQINLLAALADQAAIAVANAKLHEEVHQTFLNTVKSLAAAVEAKDPYTKGHCDMVEKYAVALAKELNLPEETVEKIQIAAILHDIGKIGVKEEVLLKTGQLTKDEWEIIKGHPLIGGKILGPAEFPDEIMAAVKFHHEQINGQGYPHKLSKDEIPLSASIVKVADAFCAMNSDRPYRKALPLDIILEELKKDAGTKFDPEVVAALLKIIEKEQKSKPSDR